MPTKEEIAKTIVDILSIYSNTIPPTFEEFMAIYREKERVIRSKAKPENTLRKMYDAYDDLKEEFGLRGPTDTEEQLNGRTDEQLETLWQKITWVNGSLAFLHDNSPEEQ